MCVKGRQNKTKAKKTDIVRKKGIIILLLVARELSNVFLET